MDLDEKESNGRGWMGAVRRMAEKGGVMKGWIEGTENEVGLRVKWEELNGRGRRARALREWIWMGRGQMVGVGRKLFNG